MLSSVFKEGKNQQYDIIKTKLKKNWLSISKNPNINGSIGKKISEQKNI
jgi:hypothetical protein